MYMEEKLVKALERTGLNVFNLERPQTAKNCIVYNYMEQNQSYEDDEASIVKYTIYVNLYCESGLNKYKNLIKQELRSEGFRLQYVAPAYKSSELKLIQEAFTFLYSEII